MRLDTKAEATKPTVGIIGAGAVGRALAHALSGAGFVLTTILDRRSAAARDLAKQTGARRAGSDLPLVGLDTQLLIIAVPDDQIAQIDHALAKHLGNLNLSVCAHTSGALCGSEMTNVGKSGMPLGSLHPLQTFLKGGPVPDLQGLFFAIEGDPLAQDMLSRLVELIGAIPLLMRSDSKTAYHAAAVFASNFLPVLMQAAMELMADAEISPVRCRQMLAPLMRQSLENCLKLGPVEALTGPVARADAATVQRHLEAIDSNHPGLRAVYCMLSLKAAELALEKGLSHEELNKLLRILVL